MKMMIKNDQETKDDRIYKRILSKFALSHFWYDRCYFIMCLSKQPSFRKNKKRHKTDQRSNEQSFKGVKNGMV